MFKQINTNRDEMLSKLVKLDKPEAYEQVEKLNEFYKSSNLKLADMLAVTSECYKRIQSAYK